MQYDYRNEAHRLRLLNRERDGLKSAEETIRILVKVNECEPRMLDDMKLLRSRFDDAGNMILFQEGHAKGFTPGDDEADSMSPAEATQAVAVNQVCSHGLDHCPPDTK